MINSGFTTTVPLMKHCYYTINGPPKRLHTALVLTGVLANDYFHYQLLFINY